MLCRCGIIGIIPKESMRHHWDPSQLSGWCSRATCTPQAARPPPTLRSRSARYSVVLIKRDDLAGGGRRPLAQPFGRSTLALRRAPRRLLACAEHHTKVMVANFGTSGTSPARHAGHAGRSDPLVLCKAGATLQCVATVESRAGHRELAFDCTPHPIIDGAFRQAVLHVHAGVLPDAVRAVLRLPTANPSSC